MIAYPNIDPVLFEAGPLVIRWYSLAYIAGIVLGAWYINFLNRKPPIIKDLKPFDDLMMWSVIGIILGGRIGYVLFYNFHSYLLNPLEIFKIWHGGMSFHGGLIGFILATFFLCHNSKLRFLSVMDLCAAAAPIGLFFGRLANFINGELYGRETTVSWAMIFPHGGNIARHPSQLYEAFLEGFCLFILLFVIIYFTKAKNKPGLISGIFLCFYALSRLIIENFREPDEQVGFILSYITMGQLLCLPMLLVGLYLIFKPSDSKK